MDGPSRCWTARRSMRRRSSGRLRRHLFNPDGWKTYDLISARSNADSGGVESVHNLAADGVFQGADVVGADQEAHGDLDPVVSDAHEAAGLNVGGFYEEALLDSVELWSGEVGDVLGMAIDGVEDDGLGAVAVAVDDGKVHLLPDV